MKKIEDVDSQSVAPEMVETTETDAVESTEVQSKRGMFPTYVDILVLFGAFFLFQFIGSIITMALGYSFSREGLTSAVESVRMTAQVDMGNFMFYTYLFSMLLLVLFTVFYRMNRHDTTRIGLSAKGFHPTLLLWGVVLLLAISVVIDPLMSIMPSAPDFVGRGWRSLLSVVILAPVFEEYICRGVVLGAMKAKRGAFVALIVSSVFFGLLHFQVTMSLNATIMGLVLGYFYIATKSLWSSIILHAFNNGLAVVLIYLGLDDATMMSVLGDNMALYAVFYAVAVIIVVVSIVKITRKLRSLRVAEVEAQAEE